MSGHEPRFRSALGEVLLERRPATADANLLAWDAADALLLEQFAATAASGLDRVLVLNDSFGALAVSLNEWEPTSWTDSAISERATADNLAGNGVAGSVTSLPYTSSPGAGFDAVIWRLPRSNDLLRHQAAMLRSVIDPHTRVWAGGMDKHLPPRSREVLEQLGPVTTLPGRKKAHVFTLRLDVRLPVPPEPAPPRFAAPEFGLELRGGPNVFSSDRLDLGTRLLADQLIQLPTASRIADLGCGSGVLGIVAQRHQPEASVHFFDESYQAIATARDNYAANCPDGAAAFSVDDGLSGYDGEHFDVIVCNPPFHQHHVVGDEIAWQMFQHSRAHLRVGGELWVVGNRHLGYHAKLARLFGGTRTLGSNPKFVALVATRKPR